MDVYLIHLEGGGDVYLKIVDKEAFDWIESPRPEMRGYSANDTTCPKSQIELRRAEHNSWPGDEFKDTYVTSGSCENDRALSLVTLEEYHRQTFYTVKEVMEEIQKRG